MSPLPAFELAAFLISSARDGLEGPPIYAASRMLDAVTRLDPANDEFVEALARRIEGKRELVMRDRAAFIAWLDELLADVAREALARGAQTPASGEGSSVSAPGDGQRSSSSPRR